jgi:hypothetical protein
MKRKICGSRLLCLLSALALLWSALLPAFADEIPSDDLSQIRAQLQTLKDDDAHERSRAELDEKLMHQLEEQIEKLDARDRALEQTSVNVSPQQFNSFMERYLGEHQFTFAGAAAGDFIYNRQTNQNTFALVFEPLVLYRLNDWILFEAEIEAGLPEGSSAEFALPVATAQIFLNDYMEVNAGIFDQPFGDWYEAHSALWVNRLVTAPLPYGAEALIPPSDIGIQLRGSAQWGLLGQDVDYTVWAANGPTFDTSLPQPVVGQQLESPTNIGVQSHGRAYGARFRIYPLPFDYKLGRLEFGASTYNGKWMNSLWLNSWGIDFAYLRNSFQARGEFLETYRQMPSGSGADNRQGWYVQAGYFLQGLPDLHLGDMVQNAIHRLEPIIRYSGVNQRAIVADEIQNTPELGFNGSPSVFSPHAREVAIGLDYWIEPSIVWQTEFDLELPRAGGTLYTFNGSTPVARPAGATPNDKSIITQIAIGF